MQIGFNLPISGPVASPEALTRIAQQGEALSYDYLTLTDHIVLPNTRVPGYPYSESGEFFGEGPERRHEQLTMAAFIAAKTSRIRLVLAVMVVPYRPAVLAAKMRSTIDVLSGGRLVVGIGAGWLQAEFNAVVTPPFAERGRITDEYLNAMRNLWTEGAPRGDGIWAKFDEIFFSRSPCKSLIHRSGSAVRAGRHSVAPPGWAMRGIRSAATTGTCSTPCHAIAPVSTGCGG
jgi:alkanesulfonate monooxygenase SsuD/methylene tetrahydromethanopterin reductase-like flavin-dependent oxidoreductase (luciferase family)